MSEGVGIGPHKQLLLDQFGLLAQAAWGEAAYLVGSVLTKPNPRDIDVRVMLSNEEYERRLGKVWQTGMRHQSLAWRAEMLAWSVLGQQMTGMNIDFQVERLSEANAKWPDERRNPIGLGLKYAFPSKEAPDAD